jgi:hypothetical protein
MCDAPDCLRITNRQGGYGLGCGRMGGGGGGCEGRTLPWGGNDYLGQGLVIEGIPPLPFLQKLKGHLSCWKVKVALRWVFVG